MLLSFEKNSGWFKNHGLLMKTLVLIVAVCGCGVSTGFAQKTVAKNNVTAPDKKKGTLKEANKTETETKTKILSRIEVKTGDAPPLLTMVVGQVTTIRLYEPSLDIFGDRKDLVINESNEKATSQNVYFIPTKAGIRRNLVIEMASGKVEFEIQSIAVESGKTVAYTREVEVKKPGEGNRRQTLEAELENLQETLKIRDQEALSFNDRLLQAKLAAQKIELKIQVEMMFNLVKTKKGRSATNSTKEWSVTEVYSQKNIDGNRTMSLFEIEYRGKTPGKFMEVKADGGSQIYWQMENGARSRENALLKKGEKIVVGVIDFAAPGTSRSLAFVTESDVVKF